MKSSDMFLKITNIFLERLRRKPQYLEKRLQFATEHISIPPEYWDDIIFSDEAKIMLCYHDELEGSWCHQDFE